MNTLRVYVTLMVLIVAFLGGCSKGQSDASSKIPKIGVIIPLTGTAAAVGEQIQNAMILANNKGKFKLIFEDSANIPANGVNAFNKLVKLDSVDAIVVGMSGVAKAVAPLARTNSITTFAISTSVPVVGSSDDRVFRYFIDGVSEAESMARYLLKTGKKRIAIIAINDEYGSTMLDSFKHILEAHSVTPVLVESFERNVTDFRSSAAKIKNADPDSVYFIGYSRPLAIVIKQVFEAGVRAQYASTFGFEIPGTKELSGKASNGLVYTSIRFGEQMPMSDASRSFVEDFKKRYGLMPSNDAAFAYDLIESLPLFIDSGALKDPKAFVGKEIESQFGKITFNKRLEALVPIVIKIVGENGKIGLVN